MRQWWPWYVIGVLFFTFCCVFNANTPYRRAGVLLHQRGPDGLKATVQDVGAPDERQHANYVAHILSGQGFPVLRPGSQDLYETYQSHQPPLYYVLAAGWCSLTGTDPLASSDLGTLNRLRLLNTVIGLFTLVAIGLGAWWGFKSRVLALTSPTLMLMPMCVALHSAVGNDPLLMCLCSWVLAVTALAIQGGWTFRRSCALGVLIGLALLTKTTALALVPTVVLALILTRSSINSKDRLKVMSLVLIVPAVICIGWLARNMNLYGDPFAMKAFNAAFVGSPKAADFINAFGPITYWSNMVGWWTARSFIGVFGYMDIFMFESMGMAKSDQINASLTLILSILALISFLAIPRIRQDVPSKRFALTAGTFLIVIVSLFAMFNKQYFQGQARYIYPAIAPISWILATGLCLILKTKSRYAWIVMTFALTLLNLEGIKDVIAGFALRLS